MSERSIFLFRSIVYMSRKRYSKKEEEDYDWISDNWEGEHPYNWYDKYGKAEPTMHEIVEKYSEDEARTILIMVKILHDTNSEIKDSNLLQSPMVLLLVLRIHNILVWTYAHRTRLTPINYVWSL